MADDGLREIAGVKGKRGYNHRPTPIEIEEGDDCIVLRRPADDVILSPVQVRRLVQQMLGLLQRVEQRAS